jgi:hypothetical protein
MSKDSDTEPVFTAGPLGLDTVVVFSAPANRLRLCRSLLKGVGGGGGEKEKGLGG